MYSLVYRFYFFLKRLEKKNSGLNGFAKKAMIYSEWYFNVVWVKLIKRFPTNKSGLNHKPRDEEIVISLTSFPKRIDTVWIAVETLLRQRMKPDRIILWLAEEQFEGIDSLPEALLAQQERGLEIRFCDDLRSHKKYFYSMQEYPDALVILADDDIFYTKDLVKKLVHLHQRNPREIVCMSVAMISEFEEVPSKWSPPKYNAEVCHSEKAQAYTGAGALFPPGSIDREYAFRKDLIRELSPYADDLWLKYMALRCHTKTTAIYPNRFMPVMIDGTASSGLWYINGPDGQNDAQWQSINDYFEKTVQRL